MKVKVAAKINLMLDILKRLDNGYHSLFMIMQSVDLYDTVTVEKNNEYKIVIKCDTEGVPCNEKNIAYKCANAFFKACDTCFADNPRGFKVRFANAEHNAVAHCACKVKETAYTRRFFRYDYRV